MNRLDADETDISKICDVTCIILMAMSIKDGVDIINNNKKDGENLREVDELKLISGLVKKNMKKR